ncbi:acetoacetate decarboxylase family protein [Nostoc sp. 'Peltigera malacea cyanobiont' DB3992]|uniref:acetoacetate decarboxylase family protein n=1 Tax=Nostoc sp. 'Peltigera malacea cyanobiont' DB3992 TaxID=1206980 RepID=UPI000C039612|nr:acetoacetate decarboxylase family protein [Nostoc sp. 'Peltigera malacea cyanobiont' DB3992]PHM08702.1 acetoacetate decarboxylase [Nostoc sp. 'Peltigera malacea cyanobiont' DB3992]
MSYPQAPWTLQGYAIQTLHLVNIDQVRPLIPLELEIISVWPGKTLASVYLSHYGSGSVLEYSELIVVPALVNYQRKIGGWVSHIYVDNADSIAGGREIWGLPKELAEFTWEQGKYVTVHQGNQRLCSLNYNQQSLAWRQWLSASSFSVKGADLLMFPAEVESVLGLIGSKLEIPAESPFSGIGLGQPWLTVRYEQMSLRVDGPKVVGQMGMNTSRLGIFNSESGFGKREK